MEHPTKGSKRLRRLVEEVSKRCKEYSTAQLLDFTRNVCRPRHPKCTECVLRQECRFYSSNLYTTTEGRPHDDRKHDY